MVRSRIPKLYNGKNKTFFFFNYEEFLETTGYAFTDTVPTTAYLNGDFSAISPNGTCSLCAQYGIPTTAMGDPPRTPRAIRFMRTKSTIPPRAPSIFANGTATPFANNMIPQSMFDQTLVVDKLFPAAQNNNLIGNYNGTIPATGTRPFRRSRAIKYLTSKDKLSFFWTRNNTESQISSPLGNADGLPEMIGGYRGTFIPTYTDAVELRPHDDANPAAALGAGYYHTSFTDRAPFLSFDPASLDLTGFLINRQFPSFTGLCARTHWRSRGSGMHRYGRHAECRVLPARARL